jgi:NAD-dependent deacetylase
VFLHGEQTPGRNTNIDDLHERAGSTHVIHLHGNFMKMRSEKACHTTFYDITGDIHR